MEQGDRTVMVDEMVAVLREDQRFHEQDFLNRYSASEVGDVRAVKLALWKAREIVRADGIVYCAVPKNPGLFERGTARQVSGQSRRQRRAGARKIERAAEKMTVAAAIETDAAEKGRLEKEAERERLRIALMSRRRRFESLR